MTARREQFGDTCSVETSFCKTKCGSETSTSGPTTSYSDSETWRQSTGFLVQDTYTTTASYSCSIRGYLPHPCSQKTSLLALACEVQCARRILTFASLPCRPSAATARLLADDEEKERVEPRALEERRRDCRSIEEGRNGETTKSSHGRHRFLSRVYPHTIMNGEKHKLSLAAVVIVQLFS